MTLWEGREISRLDGLGAAVKWADVVPYYAKNSPFFAICIFVLTNVSPLCCEGEVHLVYARGPTII